jgi:hypothetical protein
VGSANCRQVVHAALRGSAPQYDPHVWPSSATDFVGTLREAQQSARRPWLESLTIGLALDVAAVPSLLVFHVGRGFVPLACQAGGVACLPASCYPGGRPWRHSVILPRPASWTGRPECTPSLVISSNPPRAVPVPIQPLRGWAPDISLQGPPPHPGGWVAMADSSPLSWRAQTAFPRPLNAYVRLDPPVYLGVTRLA